jgi:hydrogenase nickel incorporation protein HypB
MNKKIMIKKNILAKNDEIAADIRRLLEDRKILTLNMVSSPGSGKTRLLEKTLEAMNGRLSLALIAGDVQTENDALRLTRAGGKNVRSIVTGGACHLDANMVAKALHEINLDGIDVLFIENVGNLVCPSGFDLGEDMKVALISTTEGDDKPLKYPSMFRHSSVLIINKTDLLDHTDFDMNRAMENARSINAGLEIFQTSCRTGFGLEAWYGWLKETVSRKKG